MLPTSALIVPTPHTFCAIEYVTFYIWAKVCQIPAIGYRIVFSNYLELFTQFEQLHRILWLASCTCVSCSLVPDNVSEDMIAPRLPMTNTNLMIRIVHVHAPTLARVWLMERIVFQCRSVILSTKDLSGTTLQCIVKYRQLLQQPYCHIFFAFLHLGNVLFHAPSVHSLAVAWLPLFGNILEHSNWNTGSTSTNSSSC